MCTLQPLTVSQHRNILCPSGLSCIHACSWLPSEANPVASSLIRVWGAGNGSGRIHHHAPGFLQDYTSESGTSDTSSSMHATRGLGSSPAPHKPGKHSHPGPMLPSAPVHTECRSSPLSGDRFMHDAKHSGDLGPTHAAQQRAPSEQQTMLSPPVTCYLCILPCRLTQVQ